MNGKSRILISALVVGSSLFARQKTDVLLLTNGDRITGEIKGLSGGIVRMDLDYVDGTLSIQWLKVARVESSQLFIVQAQDGSLYTGTLFTSPGRTDQIEIADTNTSVELQHSHVVKLEETSDAFWRRWNGEINTGIVFSKGNNSTQNTLGTELEYQRARWGVAAAFASNLSSSSGAQTSTRNQADITGYRLLPWKNYFYGSLGSFLQSSVQKIRLQTTVGGGIGRYFKNTNRMQISVLGGVAWQGTNYESVHNREEVAAGLVASNFKIFIFKKTNLSIRAYVVPSLTDRGRTRFNTNVSYYLKLFRNFNWNWSFYGNWDTNPPANFPASDYGYSSGIKWTFGYR